MLSLLLASAGMAGLSDQRDPPNRLVFGTGQVAGMIRMYEGQIVCVTSINGRPGGRGDVGLCDVIIAAGAQDIVRRAGADAEFEAVMSIRTDGTPPPERSDTGIPVATVSARVTVRPDGSVAACREGPGRVLRRVPGFRDPPPLCEIYPPSTEQVFTADPAQTAPRAARLDLGFYLRRP